MTSPTSLAVLASGSGTNLENIAKAIDEKAVPAKIEIVISDNEKAYALERARRRGIPTRVVRPADFPSRDAYDHEIAAILADAKIELVVLAGYMRLVGKELVEKFYGRMMNIHPALLPAFPGTHAVKDAFEYGVKVTGVTVHFVDEGEDTGPIILQEAVRVKEDDDEDSLYARIHQAEYRIYPEAIRLFCEGKTKLEGRKVRII